MFNEFSIFIFFFRITTATLMISYKWKIIFFSQRKYIFQKKITNFCSDQMLTMIKVCGSLEHTNRGMSMENGFSLALRYMKKTQRVSIRFLYNFYFEERDPMFSLGHSILYLSLPILLIIQHSSEKYLLNQNRNFCLICL